MSATSAFSWLACPFAVLPDHKTAERLDIQRFFRFYGYRLFCHTVLIVPPPITIELQMDGLLERGLTKPTLK
jgi:hypothetical protein